MKHQTHSLYLLTCIALVIAWGKDASAQTQRWFTEAWVLPTVASISNHGAREYGQGHYGFSIHQRLTQEYGLAIGRRFAAGAYGGLGVSHKRFRQAFEFAISSPTDEDRTLMNPQRAYAYDFLGIRAFGGYAWGKHAVQLILEINDPFRIQITPDTAFFINTLVFNDNQGRATQYTIEERLTPDSNPYSYVIPEIRYSYQVHKHIALLGGVKWKWQGEAVNYRLLISGGPAEQTEPDVVLNDIRIHNRFLLAYAGLNATLGWGKR
jgi:hypothetical protein